MYPQLLPYIIFLSRVHLLSVKSYIADCSFQWHSFFFTRLETRSQSRIGLLNVGQLAKFFS